VQSTFVAIFFFLVTQKKMDPRIFCCLFSFSFFLGKELPIFEENFGKLEKSHHMFDTIWIGFSHQIATICYF
jgi:hypothetical protein